MLKFKYLVASLCVSVALGGCEAPPKTVPATASGQKIDVVDLDDDYLIRLYHAQHGAPPMNRDTVINTLAVTRNSEFHQAASVSMKETDAEWREQSKKLAFRDFSQSLTNKKLGTVLAVPVAFSVMPYKPGRDGFQVCIEGICAAPYVVQLGKGAYKLHLTVTREKFLTLSANAEDTKELESEFDLMGRQGEAVLYAKVDRISLEARYAPVVYASVYRVSLKKRPQYAEVSVMGIFRYPELADIKVAKSP